MIKNIIILVVCVLFLSGYAFAEKPPWAGKGKPTAEQKQAHKIDKKIKDKIDKHRLMGRRIGFVDVHLLASAKIANLPIWTADNRLKAAAKNLSLNYS